MLERLLQWDADTLIYLNGLGNEKYDAFWSTITNFPTWIPLFILMILLFFLKFSKKQALVRILFIIILVAFVGLLSTLTKDWVGRLRPNNNEAINTLIRVLRRPTDFSFFSGHASTSFSVAVLAFLMLRKKWKWAFLFFLWPLLFSYSRIYLGVHYPLDILAGASIGSLFALLFYCLYGKTIGHGTSSVHP